MTMAQTMLTLNPLVAAAMAPAFFCVYYFLEFMVHLDRAASENHREYVPTSPSGEKILELMRYLSEHPEGDHTIDQLATRFYMSKYHMMRLFARKPATPLPNI